MRKLIRSKGKKSAAQAMVEFALALPILLLVMYGLIETGRLVFLYASVVSAARQAARYGSATGDNASGTPYYDDCQGIRAAAKNLGFIQPFSDANIQIDYDNGPGATTPWAQPTCPITTAGHPINGDRINVRVSTQYSPIVPLVPFGQFTIASSDWRTLLVGISIAVDAPSIVLTPGTGNVDFIKDANCASCSPPGSYYQWAGQPIAYTYTIYNSGSDAVNVTAVSDSLIGSVDCSGAVNNNPLAPGQTTHCYGSYTVTANDVTVGRVTNIATFTGEDAVTTAPVLEQSSKTVNFAPQPQLALAKNATEPAIVQRGAIITYTYTLTNTGNVTLYPPYAVSDNNVDAAPTCTGSSALGPGTWSSTGISPGGSTTCTAQHTITNNDMNTTYVDNRAQATAVTSGGFTVTSNVATYHALVPELLLTLSASTGIACPGGTGPCVDKLGETITYTYGLTNRTAGTISNIKINDGNGAVLSGCPTSLAAQATASCTGTYSAYTQTQFDSGIISDQASVTAQAGINSNTATASVGVIPSLSLVLSKTASTPTATTVGAPVTYTYTLTNKSNVTLKSPYTVTDNLISGVDCSKASTSIAPNGGSTTCTANYSVTTTDINNGSIVNTATATATYNPSTGSQIVTSNAASATVITYAGARLALIKTASPTVYTSSGQTITYTFTLKNTGGITLTSPYTLSDPMFTGLNGCSTSSPPPAALAPSASAICNTATYVTTTTDMGTTVSAITNTASASAQAVVSGTPTKITSTGSTTVNKFLCDATHLPYSPTPIGSGSDVTWTVTNNTGMTIHISSMTISWSGPSFPSVPALLDVLLDSTIIWNGTSPSSGGFIVPLPPTGPWPLAAGANPIELKFTATASSIRVVVTFQEAGCPVLDSNKAPAG